MSQEVNIYAPKIKCNGCLKGATGLLLEADSEAGIMGDLQTKHFTVTSALTEQQVLGCLAKYEPEVSAGQVYVKPEVKTDADTEFKATKAPDVQLTLEGMTCAACVNAVDKALHKVPGVKQAQINFASRTADIYGQVDSEKLITALQDAGYDGKQIVDPEQAQAEQLAKLQADLRTRSWHAGVGVIMGLGLMFFGMDIGPGLLLHAIAWATLALMVTTGGHFYRSGFKALRSGHANMDTLVALGTGSAWLYSMAVVYFPAWFPEAARGVYFEAAVMIIGLINLGQALELRARSKTQTSLNALLNLKASHAWVIRNGTDVEVPITQVQVGDYLRLRPGDKVPVDGVVINGETYIDEAMLTGEPIPVAKSAGDKVVGGTINQQGSLVFEATQVGTGTALARIIDMVRQAQNSKAPISRLADQVAAVFVPVVMAIAVLTAIVWLLIGPEPAMTHALVSAVSVLIIACPCALGLATPISIMLGVGKAAEMGVLVRNAQALQTASKLDWVVLDKTGTITQGKPSVVAYEIFNDAGDEQVRALAKALEQQSEHPLARAIVAHCGEIEAAAIDGFVAHQGKGVAAEGLLLGKPEWLAAEGIDMAAAQQWQQQQVGNSLMYLAQNGELLAGYALTDPVREDSAEAIRRLHSMGVKVMMLTGDSVDTAAQVAKQVGLDEFAGRLSPADKLNKLKDLQEQGLQVAMVGDGINDAPALSQADVGFAIGSGTDVAMETADLTLLRDSLHGVADAIELSQATLRNIKQNLFGAFAYNSLGIPVAAGLLFPFTGMLLNPMLAGLAMSLSSVTVVTNANRLRWFKAQR
jgi:Cu+-exporting ATPase